MADRWAAAKEQEQGPSVGRQQRCSSRGKAAAGAPMSAAAARCGLAVPSIVLYSQLKLQVEQDREMAREHGSETLKKAGFNRASP